MWRGRWGIRVMGIPGTQTLSPRPGARFAIPQEPTGQQFCHFLDRDRIQLELWYVSPELRTPELQNSAEQLLQNFRVQVLLDLHLRAGSESRVSHLARRGKGEGLGFFF